MRQVCIYMLVLVALVALASWRCPVMASGEDCQVEFKGKVGEDLDKIDVDQLLEKVQSMLSKYNFSDDDVLDLTSATEDFIATVNTYSKKLKAEDPDTDKENRIPAPHDELRDYCTKLEGFLKKYKVTVEDTLNVGRAVAFVAMSIKEEKAAKQAEDSDEVQQAGRAIASKDDVDAIFLELMQFSKKHNIMACDFIPVIYRIADIGLTFMQNRVDLKKLKEAGGRWRKRLYDLGVSKEQADGLYDALVAFVYKYKISLREILALNKDINRLLKRNAKAKDSK